jgi:hypothetical protein
MEMPLWLVELKKKGERSEYVSVRARKEAEAVELARELYGQEQRIGAIARVMKMENGNEP